MADGPTGEMPDAAQQRISQLEKRYISLLEARIAELETKVAQDSKSKGPEDEAKKTKSPKDSPNADKNTNRDEKERPEPSKDVGKSTNGDAKATDGDTKSLPKRYNIVINKWDDDKLERYDVSVDIADSSRSEKPKGSDRAFTFRRVQNTESNTIDYSEVIVESKDLQDLLAKIMPGYDVWDELSSPFQPLIQYWSEAEAEVGQDCDDRFKQARKDLEELMRIISTSSGVAELDKYFRERNQLIEDKRITHEALGTIFRRGSLVLSRPFLGTEQVFFVQSCPVSFGLSNKEDFTTTCYAFDWNGSRFTRVPFRLTIPYFEDKKDIIELPFFPLKYYVEKEKSPKESLESLKQRLVKRGKFYQGLCTAQRGKQMFLYDGPAYHQKNSGIFRDEGSMSGPSWDDGDTSLTSASDDTDGPAYSNAVRFEVRGTVMVDFRSYFAYQTESAPLLGDLHRWQGIVECDCPDCRKSDARTAMYRWDWDRSKASDRFSDEQYLCCPPRVLGYAMDKKRWMQLHVSHFREWEQTDEQIQIFKKKLQLNKDHKDLIEKSVKAHESGKGINSQSSKGIHDFAEGKGKGLVILLYGVPGVGKTLTAESVAILARKPLFSVGVSDIGIEGQAVESNLQKIFDLASLWEAVLLFDEADVFLESRGRSGDTDLTRNTMVSVLLRVLEYYEGILILTTNRMRTFDIAVQSRIHLAIKYDDLSEKQRNKIFISFIEQLEEKDLVEDIIAVKQWVEDDGKRFGFNGRQIRNVVSTAMGLARAEDPNRPKLKRSHLSKVARQTENFQKELAAQEVIYRAHQINKP